tara:strand:- start:97 stop:777 length:681 start_codon:yes stop_codon:yes gene_type:complete
MIRVLIPARKGSKGIKNKNMVNVGGKPMIYYSINEAKKIFNKDQIFVSSDSDEILNYASDLGVTGIKRPKKISRDLSTSADVLMHFIDYQKLHSNSDTKIIYLQPTSPLRTSRHIKEAIDLFHEKNAYCLVSVSKSREYPQKAFVLNDDLLEYFIKSDVRNESRQSLDATFYPNGAIYIFSVAAFNKNNEIPQDRITPYIMDKLDSIDIDDMIDLEQVERVINARK